MDPGERSAKRIKVVAEPVIEEELEELEEEFGGAGVIEEVHVEEEELLIEETHVDDDNDDDDDDDHNHDLDIENGEATSLDPEEPLDPKLLEFTPYTPEEEQALLKALRAEGVEYWIYQRENEGVSPFKLLALFGVDLGNDPTLMNVQIAWLIVAKVARSIVRKRIKLDTVNTLEDVVALIQKSSKIMVVTGAGISVSCGIPDFRSENGIYKRLHAEFNLPEPECMFDIEYFREDPQPFFSFAKEIFPGNFKPSPCHYFIKKIEDRKKLLRNYTQNIDTLEQVAGITNVVQCHGSFATASCLSCKHKVDCSVIRDDIFAQKIPRCTHCSDDDNIVKPDIVFFGEKLSDEFDHALLADRDKVDLLIVMGTSLKVAPVSSIMAFVPPHVPQILINREPITHLEFDVQLLGYCDDVTRELAKVLGWEDAGEPTPSTETPENSVTIQVANGDGSLKSCQVPCRFVPPHRYVFQGGQLAETFTGAPEEDEDDDDQIELVSDGEGSGVDVEEGEGGERAGEEEEQEEGEPNVDE